MMQIINNKRYFHEIQPPNTHYELKLGYIFLLGRTTFFQKSKVIDFDMYKIMNDDNYGIKNGFYFPRDGHRDFVTSWVFCNCKGNTSDLRQG